MEVDRAERLRTYIEETAGKPAEWGLRKSDCTSWPAQWVERERGIDLRLPDYHDEAGARAMAAAAGGLVALWCTNLSRSSIRETDVPQPGDVGVIEMSFGASGCIFGCGGVAFVRGRNGAVAIRPRRATILASFAI